MKITKQDKTIKGEITLPASKSISNRVLIIHGVSNSFEPINNLSNCDDTKSLFKVLYSNDNTFNTGDAGTAMRFLTAYLSGIIGKWELSGSERMHQRPIGELVDALNSVGAQIEYLGEEGYPPLKILGSNLTGKHIKLKAGVSSQFISAILLIAPRFKEGLTIELEGDIVSRSYIELTLSIMNEYGINSKIVNNSIIVEPGVYECMPYTVESDWSAASYIYETLALSEGGKIKLNTLKKNSYQGDSRQTELWEKLGVKTSFTKRGMFIEKTDSKVKSLKYDFCEMPDLAQTFAVTCCALGVPFVFTGVETLKIKETDRIAALVCELGKFGFILNEPAEGSLAWDGTKTETSENINVDTYKDHRMAMAFAPLAMTMDNVIINNPEVVSKSYTEYWEDLKKLGYQVE